MSSRNRPALARQEGSDSTSPTAAVRAGTKSALSGRGVEKLFPAVDRALASYQLRLGTGEVNRLFEAAIQRVNPPSLNGRQASPGGIVAMSLQ